MNSDNVKVKPLYGKDSYVVSLEYDGIEMEALEEVNKHYGGDDFDIGNGKQGCSLTFGTYYDGTVCGIRNMDLYISEYCAYELKINPGKNARYGMWALSYTAVDENTYKNILKEGISRKRYNQIPFGSTDVMSYGKDDKGKTSSLYIASFMRSEETDDEGNYIWCCSGTHPGAKIRCSAIASQVVIGANCVTIDQVLAFTGAVDEDYNRIFPDIEPTLDVFTNNIENENLSNHWFVVCALEESSGRHGVLEYLDNYAIWHEGIDYCFNFFLQNEYMFNQDGTYRSKNGNGLGRYKATVPYLKYINNKEDHLTLMDCVRYSCMTFYNEDIHYVGYDIMGNQVDWRSEYSSCNIWESYDKYKKLGLDTSYADSRYGLWESYYNKKTKKVEIISSYQEWLEKKDDLKCIYSLNFCMSEINREEVENLIRWYGAFYGCLEESDLRKLHEAWATYFRVVADPMNHRVSRWFREDINTSGTVMMEEYLDKQ